MLKWISARAETAVHRGVPHQTPSTASDTHVTYRGDWPDICRLGSTDTGTGVASRKGKAIDGNVDVWSDGNDQRCNIP